MIDLHTHSTASDGGLSPAALVREAAHRGIKALALTDHDTVSGLQEAQDAAALHGVTFVRGIEIEIDWPHQGEFHLLGLCLGGLDAAFHDALNTLACWREERNLMLIERMREAGIEADLDEVRAGANTTSLGRPHFAAFLVKRNIVRSIEQAFNRYLRKGRPLYVPKKGLPFDEAVPLIHGAGGLAVLAHPLSLYLSWGRLPDFLADLKTRGLDGIEAWHPSAKAAACARLESIARGLGLRVTAGSDFHGELRHNRALGFTAGGLPIADRFFADLAEGRQLGS
ncbi:MAG: PHP domain-containing protein [Treponema sp.]|jgi:predicted metal-dependent phosphoesterase TrpH|nr:PHP domain-containing protein [Treponema sp.]